MPFVNKLSTLLSDENGNLYSFLWSEEKIIFVFFDRKTGKSEKQELVQDCTLEYDVMIDEKNRVYLVCQKKDKSVLLMSYIDGSWKTNILLSSGQTVIYNLNIISFYEKIHIIYCVPSIESDKVYRVYHHQQEDRQWKTYEVCDVNRKEILNPFQILTINNKLLMGYYNLKKNEEQIYVRIFDTNTNQWSEERQLTFNTNYKLYLDMLSTGKGDLHLGYSQYVDGNLLIRYEKFKFRDDEIIKTAEDTLSNPGNCSHPTFIVYDEKLWLAWLEYNQVLSCHTTDMGVTWSAPYLWKESKEQSFTRYRFKTNDPNLAERYKLNYSFGKDFPNLTFIGFGSLEGAEEVPSKLKKNDIGEDEMSFEYLDRKKEESHKSEDIIAPFEGPSHEAIRSYSIKSSKKLTWEQQEIELLHEKVRELEGRIQEIEDYINRRRRGMLFQPRK